MASVYHGGSSAPSHRRRSDQLHVDLGVDVLVGVVVVVVLNLGVGVGLNASVDDDHPLTLLAGQLAEHRDHPREQFGSLVVLLV